MKLVKSKQQNVSFSYCPHPVTLDKSASWGPGNIQEFPKGVFFKHSEFDGDITHGVQPNDHNSAPVGWEASEYTNVYNKLPIWVDLGNVHEVHSNQYAKNFVKLDTLDGIVNYEIKEPSVVVAQDDGGKPSKEDVWLMSVSDLKEYYIV